MKYIEKQAQPQALIAWVRAKATDVDGAERTWGYADMPADVRSEVKRSLVREQGGLCCYTGRRISLQGCHIEHLKPQSACTEHEDTEYDNLLAAHPSSDPGTPHCAYGAHARTNWYDQHQFVHPRRRDCEQRIRYRDNGRVTPHSQDDEGAAETIRRLRLDHSEIQQMRKQAIDEALFAKQLSEAQVRRLMTAMDERDSNGNFRPFCFVIKQACEKYLKRFEASRGKK
ncbi:retron system putative HNH endonuclease [Candidatus Chloroploca sp. Khr17]|uniref:retron system putative HNH endonuclease n=1 Tax=Candidatus Chloroploca sp. Khr17 TaxID=2496869 RepID=UPI00101CF1AF|nr:retron system putative HNH endonuclease [Candidatus Chloroploca sp. Khr17]NCC32396.1 TIGR02646 family protein [Chloroflexia bacterium]